MIWKRCSYTEAGVFPGKTRRVRAGIAPKRWVMFKRHKITFAGLAVATLLGSGTWVGTALAHEKAPSDKLALGESKVKQLLLIMDEGRDGKISKSEFMSFMETEFNRLDRDNSGELDVKELTPSPVRARSGVSR
jgi:hypothetical protein